jgi:hypothetical protein
VFVGTALAWLVFHRHNQRLKTGRERITKRYKKEKPFLCFRILKERGAGLLPFLTPKP